MDQKKVKIEIYQTTLDKIKDQFVKFKEEKNKHPNAFTNEFSDNFEEWLCQIIDRFFSTDERMTEMAKKITSLLADSIDNFNLDDFFDNPFKKKEKEEDKNNNQKRNEKDIKN